MARSSPPNSEPKSKRYARPGNGKNLAPHQWKPGQSGNPSGGNDLTAQKTRIVSLAREYSVDALEELVKLMRNRKSADIRLRACIAIIERGYGKPTETVELETTQYVAYMPMPLGREEWLAAVKGVQAAKNGHAVIEHATNGMTDQPSSESLPGSPSPTSKLNS